MCYKVTAWLWPVPRGGRAWCPAPAGCQSIPGRGPGQVSGSVPVEGPVGGSRSMFCSHISGSLPLPLPSSHSLKKMTASKSLVTPIAMQLATFTLLPTRAPFPSSNHRPVLLSCSYHNNDRDDDNNNNYRGQEETFGGDGHVYGIDCDGFISKLIQWHTLNTYSFVYSFLFQ